MVALPKLRRKKSGAQPDDPIDSLIPTASDAVEAEAKGKKRTGRGRTKRVLLLDGRHTTKVAVRGNRVLSVDPVDHKSAEIAESAAKKAAKGNTAVIWHSHGQAFIRDDKLEEGLNPKAKQVQMLDRQIEMFTGSVPAAMWENTDGFFSCIGLNADRSSRWVHGKVHPGAFAVLTDQDGAWVRIGWDSTDMTLVSGGEVVSWEHLGDGIEGIHSRLSNLISEGARAAEQHEKIRSEHNDEIAQRVHVAIGEWQQSGWSVPQIILHGPGAESPDEMRRVLTRHTGLIVTEPSAVLRKWTYLAPGSSWLPAALAAVENDLPKLIIGNKIAAMKLLLQRARLWGSVALAVLVVAGMWWKSASDGQAIQDRVAAADARKAAAEQKIAADEAASSDLAASDVRQSILSEIGAFGPPAQTEETTGAVLIPDWEALFDFWEVWVPLGQVEPEGITPDKGEWTLTVADPGTKISGHLEMRYLLDEWVEAVWGHCARGTVGADIALDDREVMPLTMTLKPIEGCDPNAPPDSEETAEEGETQ